MSSNHSASENLQRLPDALKKYYNRELCDHSMNAMVYAQFGKGYGLGGYHFTPLSEEELEAMRKYNQHCRLKQLLTNAKHDWKRRTMAGMLLRKRVAEAEQAAYDAASDY